MVSCYSARKRRDPIYESKDSYTEVQQDGRRDPQGGQGVHGPGTSRDEGARAGVEVKTNAPALLPRTWYGMPAYARDGNVVCFFHGAHKFKARYATFGFSDKANLDEGTVWPVAFALKELTAANEARIGALVKKAVS